MTPDCRLTGAALVKKVSKVIELIRFSQHPSSPFDTRKEALFALREITRNRRNTGLSNTRSPGNTQPFASRALVSESDMRVTPGVAFGNTRPLVREPFHAKEHAKQFLNNSRPGVVLRCFDSGSRFGSGTNHAGTAGSSVQVTIPSDLSQNGFTGSVPSGQATAEVLPISFQEPSTGACDQNLGLCCRR